MAIAAIYIFVFIAIAFFSIGLFRKDPTLTIFSGFLFIFSGLTIIRSGFEDLAYPYYYALGLIILFMGAYISLRTAVELIQEAM